MSHIRKTVNFCGRTTEVGCDALCSKAWGRNTRPNRGEMEGGDLNYLADSELGEAPTDPGSRVADIGKPKTPEDRLNRWCINECERSLLAPIHQTKLPQDPAKWPTPADLLPSGIQFDVSLASELADHAKFTWRAGAQMVSRKTGKTIVLGSGSRIGHDDWMKPRPLIDPMDGERVIGRDGKPRLETWKPPSESVPDLADYATAGTLVGLLEDLEFAPHFWVGNGAKEDGSDSCGVHLRDNRRFVGFHLGEAAAQALLAIYGETT